MCSSTPPPPLTALTELHKGSNATICDRQMRTETLRRKGGDGESWKCNAETPFRGEGGRRGKLGGLRQLRFLDGAKQDGRLYTRQQNWRWSRKFSDRAGLSVRTTEAGASGSRSIENYSFHPPKSIGLARQCLFHPQNSPSLLPFFFLLPGWESAEPPVMGTGEDSAQGPPKPMILNLFHLTAH